MLVKFCSRVDESCHTSTNLSQAHSRTATAWLSSLRHLSLHNRRFMSLARRTWHLREKRDEGRRKIKRLLPVHCSGSSAHPRPQVLTDSGDVKRTNQNTIHYSKIVTFLATKHSRSRASILSVSVGDQKVSRSGFFLT